MQFGFPTLIETEDAHSCAALCRELGFDFVELNMNLPQYQPGCMSARELARIAEEFGVYYTIHLDENLNPCDFNPLVADAYVQSALRAIDMALELGCPVVNMHMAAGVYFTLPDERVYLFDRYLERYLGRLRTFRDRCEKAAGQSGLHICVENTGGWDKAFMQKGLALLLESPEFGLTFDIGHNAAAGKADEAFFLQNTHRLCHMHVHDARGKQNHLPLGEGALDISDYLKMAKAHGCRAVIETKTIAGLQMSARWLKDSGYL